MSKTTVPKHDFYRAAKLSLLNFLSLLRDLQKNYSGISKSRRDSVGGGGVAEFVRVLQKLTRFSGGGGVVAEFFWDLQKPTRFSGGGVVAGFVSVISETRHHSVGGGGVVTYFQLSSVAKSRFYPTSSDIRG